MDSAPAWATILWIDLNVIEILIIRLFTELCRTQLRDPEPEIFLGSCITGVFIRKNKTQGNDVVIHSIAIKAMSNRYPCCHSLR